MITQGHWGTSREKPITIVFCTCSFSGRFCIFFCQGQVWGEPAVANQPPRGGLSTSGTGRRAQPRSARRGKVARTAATQCGHRSAALLPLVFQCLCMCVSLIFTTNGSFAHGVTPSLLYVPWEDGRASGNRTTFPQPSRGILPGPRPPPQRPPRCDMRRVLSLRQSIGNPYVGRRF